jgi:hypothetical protein
MPRIRLKNSTFEKLMKLAEEKGKSPLEIILEATAKLSS